MASHTHERARRDHATELAEDYAEAIDDIISQSGICRAMDLVERFQVTHATVSNAVGRLVRDGFATSQPYQPIELTAKGKRLARKARYRHEWGSIGCTPASESMSCSARLRWQSLCRSVTGVRTRIEATP